MNKIIKEQLNQCRVAQIPQFDEHDSVITIARGDTAQDVLILNQYYLIQLEDWIIEEHKKGYDWNKGVSLQSTQLKCSPTQFAGSMTRFDAVGFDPDTQKDKNDVYLGLWMPRNSFKIIKKL